MGSWFQEWHGTKISTADCSFNPGSGGSTTASTGVTLALSSKASVGHSHPTSDVTGLDSSLAGLAAQVSTKASGSHAHALSDVTGLESSLAGLAAQLSTKAAGTHTHALADVTGLESSLAGLAAQMSTKAAGSHAHAIGDITGLQSTLDLKAASTHTHAVVTASTTGFCPTLPANSTTFLRSDGNWGSPPSGGGGPVAVKTSAGSTISSTFGDVVGLAFAVSSASAYYFEFFLNWNVRASTNGAKFGITGPASPTLVNLQMSISTGPGNALVRSARSYDTCVAITAAGSTLPMATWMGGMLVTGANAGTLQARAAPRVTSTSVVVSSASAGFLFGPL